MQYWLFKSEPDCFGIDTLKAKKIAPWDGVRNYQARNYLRSAQKGDLVIFYHSSCAVPAAVGVAEVVKGGYPDHTAWDPKSEHPDPKSTPEKPLWYMVDVKYKSTFVQPLSLTEMKSMPELAGMKLLQKGSRLSVMPVSKNHFDIIMREGAHQ